MNLPETADYQRIARVLGCLDVQMFFGQGECFASSIAEASGIGVPTIALATPLRDNGQAEQITDDVNGYLVGEVNQAVRFANALMSEPDKLRSMKRAAKELCHARWSVADRAASDLLGLYEFWRDPSRRPDYVDLMLEETDRFGAGYRDRIARLMGQGRTSHERSGGWLYRPRKAGRSSSFRSRSCDACGIGRRFIANCPRNDANDDPPSPLHCRMPVHSLTSLPMPNGLSELSGAKWV